jgi:hypothetical protein
MRDKIATVAIWVFWIAVAGGLVWFFYIKEPPPSEPTVTLVILSSGVATVPGYITMDACKVAAEQLRRQADPTSSPVTACIPAGTQDPYR